MFPALPAPFMEIDGRFLADGLQWGGLLVKLPPTSTATISITAYQAEAASQLEQAAVKGLEIAKALMMAEMLKGSTANQAMVAGVLPLLVQLKPQLDNTRLTLTLGDDEAELAAIKSVLVPAIGQAQESAVRNQRSNQLKQMAIAFLNYESAKKSLPPAAIYSEDGKPLLSWRVAILPYLEQQELYNQFHLDEPWDSEHNRALIAKMPDMYADPRHGGSDGRTPYVVPTGERTVFPGREGMSLREINDGLSNTILVVQAAPENTVIWTKPEDWEVDFSDPLRGVRRGASGTVGNVFAAAYCDGHVTHSERRHGFESVRRTAHACGEGLGVP